MSTLPAPISDQPRTAGVFAFLGNGISPILAFGRFSVAADIHLGSIRKLSCRKVFSPVRFVGLRQTTVAAETRTQLRRAGDASITSHSKLSCRKVQEAAMTGTQ